jgi:hypothetical protein
MNPGPGSSYDTYTCALNSADQWLAYQFQCPPAGATPSKVMAYCSAENGTVTSGIACEIYSNSATGLPNASVDAATAMTADCAPGTWLEFTGFDAALTGGASYWIVLKNTTATPGTNYPTFRYLASQQPIAGSAGTTAEDAGAARVTADAGTGWAAATARYQVGGWRIEYSGGGVQGCPVSTVTISDAGTAVYDSREQGAKFTSPTNAKLRVVGALASIRKNGSPTSNYRFRLYKDTTLIDTSNLLNAALLANATIIRAYFATVRELDTASTYRIVLGSDNSGTCDSSNYLRCYTQTYQDSDASRLLMPGRGWFHTYLDGTWTDSTTLCPMISLLLDQDGEEFGSVAGGLLQGNKRAHKQ